MVDERGLNEATYTAIMVMGQDEKNSLPDRIKKHVNTAKKAQNFVNKSSLELKRELFEYLRYSIYFILAPVGIEGERKFLKAFEEYKNGDIQSGLREAAKSGIYVCSDREFSFLLGQMSQSMTTAPYAKNHELVRAGNVLKKWPVKLANNDDEYDTDAEAMVKIILWSEINFDETESAVGLSPESLRVLFFMYLGRRRYLSRESIGNFFTNQMGSPKMGAIIKFLSDKFFIQKHVDWRKKEYTITKLGIRTVHQFRDRVLKSFNF